MRVRTLFLFPVVTLLFLTTNINMAKALPIISQNYLEPPSQFDLTMVGRVSTGNFQITRNFAFGTDWLIDLIITADDFGDDQLWIRGFAQHLKIGVVPIAGSIFPFNFAIDDAGDFGAGSHSLVRGVELRHPGAIGVTGGIDSFFARLDFNVNNTGFPLFNDNISSYQFSLSGRHRVAEPSTILLFAFGLTGIWLTTRKRNPNTAAC